MVLAIFVLLVGLILPLQVKRIFQQLRLFLSTIFAKLSKFKSSMSAMLVAVRDTQKSFALILA